MYETKLFYDTALKVLKDKNNFLVWFFPWNGLVRNHDGEEVGVISQKVMNRLLESEELISYGVGTELLSHERYFRYNPELLSNNKQ